MAAVDVLERAVLRAIARGDLDALDRISQLASAGAIGVRAFRAAMAGDVTAAEPRATESQVATVEPTARQLAARRAASARWSRNDAQDASASPPHDAQPLSASAAHDAETLSASPPHPLRIASASAAHPDGGGKGGASVSSECSESPVNTENSQTPFIPPPAAAHAPRIAGRIRSDAQTEIGADAKPNAVHDAQHAQEPRKRRASRMPEPGDFGAFAERLGIAAALAERPDVAQQWADHHRAKGTLAVDWAASWRTWMRNEQRWSAERAARGGGGGRHVVQRPPQDLSNVPGDWNPGDPF